MGKKIAALISVILFVTLTSLLRVYDVAPIGPDDTEVDFSHINQKVHELTGINMDWYNLTNAIGYGAILLCAVFALAGLVQLIKRKSLFKVDREILALGGLFILDIFLYVFFEKIIINYRPVIMPGETAAEASFPSSHTVLGLTVFIAALLITDRYIKSRALSGIIKAVCAVIAVVAVVGRLLSGVHWATDILGGILLSAALLFAFSADISAYRKNEASGNKKPLTESDKVINGYRCKH